MMLMTMMMKQLKNIDSDSEIKNIINKAFNKPKELIRGPIKKLIEKNTINR